MTTTRRTSPMRGAARRAAVLLDRTLPHGPLPDAAVQLLRFAARNGRLPDREGYSDALLRRLISPANRSALRRRVSDKEEVKAHVAERVGARHVVPTLALWDAPEEVDLAALPPECCIKPTHMSGAFAFRRGGGPVDLGEVRSWFGADYYRMSREGNYAGLRRRVMVEPLVFGRESPWDYKFVCSAGRVRLVHLNLQVRPHYRRVIAERDLRPLAFAFDDGEAVAPPPPPASLGRMIDIAERLAADFDFVRVDLYTDGEEVRFGELTNVPFAGLVPLTTRAAERALGREVFGPLRAARGPVRGPRPVLTPRAPSPPS